MACLLAGVVAVALAACRPAAPPVTAEHATWAASRWPDVTMADLEQGRSLLLARCSGCHRPPAPSAHAPGDWPGALDEMGARANLEPRERHLIEQYVVTLASLK